MQYTGDPLYLNKVAFKKHIQQKLKKAHPEVTKHTRNTIKLSEGHTPRPYPKMGKIQYYKYMGPPQINLIT